MRGKIEKVINEEIRPYMYSHGGNVEFLNFNEGIVELKIHGKCCNCPTLNITLEDVVKEKLLKVQGVKHIVLSQMISNETLDFAKKLLRIE